MKLRRWHKFGLGAAGLLLALGLLALTFPQRLLTVDSGEVQADALVVLGGKAPERAERAAELFLSGAAPKIILTGADDGPENKRVLVRKGVPASAISLEPNSRTTRQNAQFTIPLLRTVGARRVIIVTSWYHSRRGLNTFRHYAPDVQFYSRPAYVGFAQTGWSIHGTGRYIRAEYIKLAGYCLCYGVRPF